MDANEEEETELFNVDLVTMTHSLDIWTECDKDFIVCTAYLAPGHTLSGARPAATAALMSAASHTSDATAMVHMDAAASARGGNRRACFPRRTVWQRRCHDQKGSECWVYECNMHGIACDAALHICRSEPY